MDGPLFFMEYCEELHYTFALASEYIAISREYINPFRDLFSKFLKETS